MSTPRPPYGGFPRNQRLGLGIFLILCLLILAFVAYQKSYGEPHQYAGMEEFRASVAALRTQRATATAKTLEPAVERFYFDPNTVSQEELVRLGLSPKQAGSWIKYRGNRPNAFRRPEDIKKLYVLDEETASTLLPLVRLKKNTEAGADAGAGVNSRMTTAAKPPPPAAERFPFDPNTLSPDSLQLLGLTSRQTATLVKYRSYRPQTFRRAEDLYRVRALDSALVTSLLSFVIIAPAPANEPIGVEKPTAPVDRAPQTPRTYTPIDINAAPAQTWATLPGIGEFRARKILNYREKLGGFYQIQQVGETYGIPDSVYQTIAPYLQLTTPPRQLSINTATAAELRAHPNIPGKLANVLVNYRARHGVFTGPADLANIRILDDETRDRILPYLRFD